MTLRSFASIVVVLSLAACTVRTTDGSGSSSGSGSGTAQNPAASSSSSGGSSSGGSSSGGSSGTTPSGSAPAEVVGSWTWVTSNGGQSIAFAANGAYTSDTLVNGHPGESCGTEYLAHREGTATFTATTVNLRGAVARRTKSDSCKDAVIAVEDIDAQDDTYTWRVETGTNGARSLVMTGKDGYEATYSPDGT